MDVVVGLVEFYFRGGSRVETAHPVVVFAIWGSDVVWHPGSEAVTGDLRKEKHDWPNRKSRSREGLIALHFFTFLALEFLELELLFGSVLRARRLPFHGLDVLLLRVVDDLLYALRLSRG